MSFRKELLMNVWTVEIVSGLVVGIILLIIGYCFFRESKSKEITHNNGGHGGNVKIKGNYNTAIAGKGGGGGPVGKGGNGGSVVAEGNNIFAMGGEGGEAGQIDRGGRGGRAPLHVLMEDLPDKFKEISTFGITEEDAKKYGKGGDGAGPAI